MPENPYWVKETLEVSGMSERIMADGAFKGLNLTDWDETDIRNTDDSVVERADEDEISEVVSEDKIISIATDKPISVTVQGEPYWADLVLDDVGRDKKLNLPTNKAD